LAKNIKTVLYADIQIQGVLDVSEVFPSSRENLLTATSLKNRILTSCDLTGAFDMHLDISPADVFRLTDQRAAAMYRQSIDLAGSTPNIRFLERGLASCLSK